MHARRSGGYWFVHFEPGVQLHEAYRGFARRQGITAGVVVSGIGMVKDPELGFYDGEKYHVKRFRGAYELVSTQGNIALLEEEPFTHLHVSIAGKDYAVKAGHLFSAEVHVSHEGAVRAFDGLELHRSRDPVSQLARLRWEESVQRPGPRLAKGGVAKHIGREIASRRRRR